MRQYIMGQSATASGIVRYYDLNGGIAAAVRTVYNFIIDGGYTPSGSTGVACSDEAKGALTLNFFSGGLQGNPPTITVVDGPATGPINANAVPLNVYAADGTEPWVQYTMQKAGVYIGQLVFKRTGWPAQIIDQWEETWG